jgi:plasmid stabilization system protein ParE
LRGKIPAQQSPSYGKFVLTSSLLARHPALGRETDIPGVRLFPTARYPYLVYHRVHEDEVVIVHVRHGRRDAPKERDL